MTYYETRYELDYTVFRDYESVPGVYERECGTVKFPDVFAAQEFCETPAKMLAYFHADRGKFALRCGNRPFGWEWVFELKYDPERVNRLPLDYRLFRDAIFNME